jgi:hypothetical protein
MGNLYYFQQKNREMLAPTHKGVSSLYSPSFLEDVITREVAVQRARSPRPEW